MQFALIYPIQVVALFIDCYRFLKNQIPGAGIKLWSFDFPVQVPAMVQMLIFFS